MQVHRVLMLAGIALTLAGLVVIALGEPRLETGVRTELVWTVDVVKIPPGNYTRTVYYKAGGASLYVMPGQETATASLVLDSSRVERPECRQEPIQLAVFGRGVYKNPPEGQGALQLNLTLALTQVDGGYSRVLRANIILPPPPQNLTPHYAVDLEEFKAYAAIQPTIEYSAQGKVLGRYTRLIIEPLGKDLPTVPPGRYEGLLEARLNGTGLNFKLTLDARVKCEYVEEVRETQTLSNVEPRYIHIPVVEDVNITYQKAGLLMALAGNLITLLSTAVRRGQ